MASPRPSNLHRFIMSSGAAKPGPKLADNNVSTNKAEAKSAAAPAQPAEETVDVLILDFLRGNRPRETYGLVVKDIIAIYQNPEANKEMVSRYFGQFVGMEIRANTNAYFYPYTGPNLTRMGYDNIDIAIRIPKSALNLSKCGQHRHSLAKAVTLSKDNMIATGCPFKSIRDISMIYDQDNSVGYLPNPACKPAVAAATPPVVTVRPKAP